MVMDFITFALPLGLLQAMLDYVVHMQYDFLNKFSVKYVVMTYPARFLALSLFVYFTNKHVRSRLMQLCLVVTSIASSISLIYYTKEDETFGMMKRTPGLAVLWIYSAMQLDLPLVLFSLLFPLGYYYRDMITANPLTKLEL